MRAIHVHHREEYSAHPVSRPMGAGMDLAARRKDGTEFPAEILLAAIETEGGLLVSAAIRDGTERKQRPVVQDQVLWCLALPGPEAHPIAGKPHRERQQ